MEPMEETDEYVSTGQRIVGNGKESLEQSTDSDDCSDSDSSMPFEKVDKSPSIRHRLVDTGENKENPSPDGSPWAKRKDFLQTHRPKKSFEQFVEEDELKAKLKAGPVEKKTIDDYAFRGLSQRSKNSQWKNLLLSPIMGLLAIIAISFAFLMCAYWTNFFAEVSSFSRTASTWEECQTKLESGLLRQFQKQFPSQDKDTVVHLLSAINSTLSNQEPKQPSCITILVPPTVDPQFPICLTRRLSKFTNGIFSNVISTRNSDVLTFNSNYFAKFGKDITKIHSDLATYFQNGGRAVVVQDVEKLTEEDHLLIFHSLCDNFKAPEKRASIFFTIPVPQYLIEKYGWGYAQASDLSYYALDDSWKFVSGDTRPALIARIAATVILLNDGDTCYEY